MQRKRYIITSLLVILAYCALLEGRGSVSRGCALRQTQPGLTSERKENIQRRFYTCTSFVQVPTPSCVIFLTIHPRHPKHWWYDGKVQQRWTNHGKVKELSELRSVTPVPAEIQWSLCKSPGSLDLLLSRKCRKRMSVFRGGVLDQEQCLYLGRRPPGVGQLVLRPGINNLMSLLLIKDHLT